MSNSAFHIHFESRRQANPVFQITQERVEEALARRPDVADRIRVTVGRDLEIFDESMKTAKMLVGFYFPRERLMDGAPILEGIQLTGAGLEALAPFDWVPEGVRLFNNGGVHSRKAAEFITMAVLMLNSRTPSLINAQQKCEWKPIYTGSCAGKTLLVVGMGKLAAEGVAICKRFGMVVVGIRRSGEPHPNCDRTVSPCALHDEIPLADIALLTVPATPETTRMIGAREISLMKRGASLINFARGNVLDHEALREALVSGHLAGAVLDVFDQEPLPSSSSLWETPNLFISPHCASDDVDLYMPQTLDIALENAWRLMEGREPVNLFDPLAGY